MADNSVSFADTVHDLRDTLSVCDQSECEVSLAELEQLLKNMLLQSSLLLDLGEPACLTIEEEDQAVEEDSERNSLMDTTLRPGDLAMARSSFASTLRGMRQSGPLASVSPEIQSELLGGTLFEYGDATSRADITRQRTSPLLATTAPAEFSFGAEPPSGRQTTLVDLRQTLDSMASRQLSDGSLGHSAAFTTTFESDSGLGDSFQLRPGSAPGDVEGANGNFGDTWASDQSAQTVLGDTLGMVGGFADVLRRMALDEHFDDSLIRTAHRLLQLGAALAGQRLSDDEIRALPKVRFDDKEEQSCAICLEPYTKGELLTSLRCNHFFHVECLTRWFQRSAQCPLCRSQVD